LSQASLLECGRELRYWQAMTRSFLSIWLCGAILCPALAQNPVSQSPTYLGRRIAQTMHFTGADWLTRHEREQEEAGAVMRKELRLKPGMNVCDMGCGNGYHTIPMARAVAPGGKIFGVDIQPEMLDLLRVRAMQAKAENIVYVPGAQTDAKLPDASCDLILMVDVYHELSDPEPMLQSMKKALKPGGQIVLVEFRSEDDSVPIKPEHKMSKEQILKEMTANGYHLTRSFDKLPWQHMMFFAAGQEAAAPIDKPTSKP
jgi:ubiquinone/menaquinone biosynthesis C-methylase UbiE